MKFFTNRKLTIKTLKEIRERLEDGERMSVNDIVNKYFMPKSSFNLRLAMEKANQWLCGLTKQYNKEGKLFGRLGMDGKYGFAENHDEPMFTARRGYILAKGHILSSMRNF